MSVPSNLVPTRLSQLPIADTPTVNDTTVIVQNGVSKRTSLGSMVAAITVPTNRNIYTGGGLQGGGPLSSDLFLSLATVGTDGTVGSGSFIPVLSVSAQGQVYQKSQVALTFNNIQSTPTTVAGYGITDAVPTSRLVATGGSLVGGGDLHVNHVFSLENDQDAPGATKYYGTNPAGARGWYTLSAGGTVQQINTGAGLTGGPITNSGTISLANTTVGTGTYGSSTQIGSFTVDQQGRLTSASNITVAPAFSSITGTPTTLGGYGITDGVPTSRNINTGTGLAGGGNLGADRTLYIATTGVTAANYGSATTSPVLSVNAQGQITSASNVTITPAFSSITGTPTTLSGYGITDGANTATTISAGTGLSGGGSLAANRTLSIANTAVTAASYGSSSQVGTFTVNAQGQLTAAANASIAVDASAITTGTLPVSRGGTGVATITGYLKGAGTSAVTGVTAIPNADLVNSSVTLGTTNVALGATSLTVGGLTSVAVTQDPSAALQLATKQYVDNMATAGIDVHTAVVGDADSNLAATYAQGGTTPTVTTIASNVLTTSANHGLSVNDMIVFNSTSNGLVAGTAYFVYSIPALNTLTLASSYNGTQITTLTDGSGLSLTSRANSGVGATLTSTSNGPLTIEGYTFALNDRILLTGQTAAYQNGVYYVSQVGITLVAPWILTRATDGNKYIPNSNAGLDTGAYFLVTGGGDAGEAYVLSTTGSLIIGTTNLTFAQFSQVPSYTSGTGLTLTGTQFSIANTAVTAASYGSATQVGTFTVNAQGQLTTAANVTVTPAWASITSTPTTIAGYGITNGALNTTTISAGTGLSGGGDLSANRTLSLANTTVAAASYGSASSVGTFTVNAQGQLTAAASTAIAIAASQITSGQLGVANGGTGVATITGLVKGNGTAAFSAAVSGTDYAPATSGSSILYGNGSGGFSSVTVGTGLTFTSGTLASSASGTVTSVNASGGTSGLSFSGGPITTSGTLTLGGTLNLANGGTGATTVAQAQSNLQVDPAGTAVALAIALG